MGCGGSTGFANEKATIAGLDIHGYKQAWNGMSVSGGNVLKCKKVLARAPARSGGKLQDAAGTVLLDVVPHGNKRDGPYCFNTPDGKTVVLFANTKGGDRYHRGNSEYVIWTAADAAESGKPPEATPTGASMFKFGTIKTNSSGAPAFFDASDTKVMIAKDWRDDGLQSVVLYSADGTTPLAVVEGMQGCPPCATAKGPPVTVSFAKGVDPIVALCVAWTGNWVLTYEGSQWWGPG